MRPYILFLFFFFSTIFVANVSAQVTVAALDTSYAHGGKLEIALSNFGDEFIDFSAVFPDIHDSNTVTVCAKVGTADSSLKKLGLFRLNPNGTFDSTFGKNGKVIASSGISDYPNAMYVSNVDSSILAAGMSAISLRDIDRIPALFKFRKNGQPDYSFGGDGHVAVRYDTVSGGEFTNIFTQYSNLIACGNIKSSDARGHNGFCAMRFFPNGKLDPSFGVGGKALISARVHSVFGFSTKKNASITFIGVADIIDSESKTTILMARLTPDGLPDSSFGTNGILDTRVLVGFGLNGENIIHPAIQSDYKIVAALSPTGVSFLVPFILIRFTTEGVIDSSYGTNGFVRIAFGPDAAESKGVNIAKNGKAVVNGSHNGRCATARINIDGTPDITFNKTGNATIDVDSNTYPNYLKRFEGIGNKRYMGFGGSVHDGKTQILIARFKDDTLHSAVKNINAQNNEISIYPNPVSSVFKVMADSEMKSISIIDALGREVMMLNEKYYSGDSKTFSFDAHALPNGIYYCVAENSAGRVRQKFIVEH